METDEHFALAAIRVSGQTTDIAQIASRIPLPPTRKVDAKHSASQESRWIYESTISSSLIEDHIAALEGHRTSFESLPADCQIDIWCTISTSREFAGFGLSRDVLQRASSLNLQFVFGIYVDSAVH
jgi:hypothetical protein